ncbi:MAG TPA: hypothetical protein VEX68_16545 [Bryobacteraceae bacterium]|nr:hypothetical protein [Bryobacteraceae bacterium]
MRRPKPQLRRGEALEAASAHRGCGSCQTPSRLTGGLSGHPAVGAAVARAGNGIVNLSGWGQSRPGTLGFWGGAQAMVNVRQIANDRNRKSR